MLLIYDGILPGNPKNKNKDRGTPEGTATILESARFPMVGATGELAVTCTRCYDPLDRQLFVVSVSQSSCFHNIIRIIRILHKDRSLMDNVTIFQRVACFLARDRTLTTGIS